MTDTNNDWASRRITQLEAENAKLTESYWNMSRTLKLTQEERDTAEARVRELEAEQDEALKRLQNQHAENERLLADRDAEKREHEKWWNRGTAAEPRLAAATALVERVRMQASHMRDQAHEFRLNPGVCATYNECAQGIEMVVGTEAAFLASQPAAPVSCIPGTNGECSSVACPEREAYRQPAAPTRTEAEQAVLDAMARADTEELIALVGGELPDTPLWEVAACRAELVRRGVK